MIGFQKSVIYTSEEKRHVKIKVKLYSGSDVLLPETHDVQFVVNLHSENRATQGKCTYINPSIHTYLPTYIHTYISTTHSNVSSLFVSLYTFSQKVYKY